MPWIPNSSSEDEHQDIQIPEPLRDVQIPEPLRDVQSKWKNN